MTSNTMDVSSTDSMSYYDDDEEQMQGLTDRFQFTGMDCLGSPGTDDSWDVESYAADSMEITKMRMVHLNYGDDGSSLGEGSARRHAVLDEEDWTVSSDCNDSVGLIQTRLDTKTKLYHYKVKPQLARVTRRRASMGDVVKEELGGPVAPSLRSNRPTMRRSSMSSVSTVEVSLSSHGSGSSDDPAGKRPSVFRHKSMPFVKAPAVPAVPMWSEPRREKMARRVSNSGRPCAA